MTPNITKSHNAQRAEYIDKIVEYIIVACESYEGKDRERHLRQQMWELYDSGYKNGQIDYQIEKL